MLEQQGQSLLEPSSDCAVMAAPKQTMVNQQSVCARLDGGFNEGATRCHARNDVTHLLPAFNLQPIGTVVLELDGLQQVVAQLKQVIAVYHLNAARF
jgi:hypothetical protein